MVLYGSFAIWQRCNLFNVSRGLTLAEREVIVEPRSLTDGILGIECPAFPVFSDWKFARTELFILHSKTVGSFGSNCI